MSEKMGLFGPISAPSRAALRGVYRGPIMGELRKNPEKHLALILDLAIATVAREQDVDKILWLAEKVGLRGCE